MSGVMESVNKRTQLVGQNRMELLLFRLAGKQLYGINVFKVKEVLQCPKLTLLPRRNPTVRGVAHIRMGTISVIDLSMATGQRELSDIENCFVVITEYNCKTQGFLVRNVDRIVNMNWEDIHPPPAGAGAGNYLTAVSEIEGTLVEILDVEKILSEVSPSELTLSDDAIKEEVSSRAASKHILIVDDSGVARKQIKRLAETVGVTTTTLNDGRQAIDHLKSLVADDSDIDDHLLMMISDIEMPEMDGYTLTAEVRSDPRLAKLFVLLHTSLSGVFNEAMVKKVGADDFLAKFHPDELAKRVGDQILKRDGVKVD